MNKKLPYISLAFGALLLVGIGILVDRVGGFAIRTDDVSSPILFSLSQPFLRGVPLTIRWSGQNQENIPVVMELISASETSVLGNGKLFAGSMRVTIPCVLPSNVARLQLLDANTRTILAVSSVLLLPEGPDCVR